MDIRYLASALAIYALVGSAQARAQDSLISYKSLAPETALDLARAALADCQKRGYQVAVAIVDRFGVVQVVLRDRYAGLGQGLDRRELPQQHKQSFRHQPARNDAGGYSNPTRRRDYRRRTGRRVRRLAGRRNWCIRGARG